MQVLTIYWDEQGGTHHNVVCEVKEDGSHSVLHSYVGMNDYPLSDVVSGGEFYFGAANVRAYKITEYKGDEQ